MRGPDEALPRSATACSDARPRARRRRRHVHARARARSPRSSARAAAARAPSRACSRASTRRRGGSVVFDGTRRRRAIARARDVLRYRSQVQMIFQDPFGSLNPVKTIRHHLARPLRIHGLVDARRASTSACTSCSTTVGLVPPERIRREVPARALGRPAAARRDRARARRRADRARRRRADLDARRLDPHRDPQPDARPEGTQRGSRSSTSPTISRARATSRTTCSSCTPARSSSKARSRSVLQSRSIRTRGCCSRPVPDPATAPSASRSRCARASRPPPSTRRRAAASSTAARSRSTSAPQVTPELVDDGRGQSARCHVTAPSPAIREEVHVESTA